MTLARRLLMGAGGSGSFEVEMAIPDPRVYDSTPTSGRSTLYNPLTDPGNGLYARVIKSTPGLMQWWRLGKTFSAWGSAASHPPFWANSAGASTLWSPAGSTLASGLLTGDADGACALTASQYLEAFDYFVQPSTHEIITAECWVNLSASGADTALMGEWASGNGWMIRAGGTDLELYVGSNHIDAAGVLTTGVKHHIVGVIGGTQAGATTPDYYSRLYVDGAEVVNGITLTGALTTTTSRFQINQYGAAGGTGLAAGTWDEVATYSRMLQPDEITQHHQAGLGVLWP